MYWFGLGLVLTCLCPYLVISLKHPGIYWNISSFQNDQIDHIINVNLHDEVDILCPYYPIPKAISAMEYYIIYQVPENVYHDCNLRNTQPLKLLNCSVPLARRRLTILFTQYAAIPNTPEFRAGESYYFITTSTGSRSGMDNRLDGACKTKHMKVKFNVCCGPETTLQKVTLQNHSIKIFADDKFYSKRTTNINWKEKCHRECEPTEKPTTPTKVATTPLPAKTTGKPSKPEGKKPVKDDKYGENDVRPKDQRQVGDTATSSASASHGLVVCSALVAIRLLSWLHCR